METQIKRIDTDKTDNFENLPHPSISRISACLPVGGFLSK